MDWRALEQTAVAILRQLLQFSGAIEVNFVLEQIKADEALTSRSASEQTRIFYQAIDVLEHLGMIERPDGVGLALSPRGRQEVERASLGLQVLDISDPALLHWAEDENRALRLERHPVIGPNRFERLQIENWRQFGSVDIVFHPRLTVLTGANAAGKTTLLNILAPHFSWSAQFLSASELDSRRRPKRENRRPGPSRLVQAGRLRYTNGARTQLLQPPSVGVSVSALGMPSQQTVPGIFISSHRSISSYQPLQHLPAKFSAGDVLLDQFVSELNIRHNGGSSQFPPLYRMKEALVGAAMYGYGNRAVRANEEALEVWEGFQDVLSSFLPDSLRFERLVVSDGDILIQTEAGAFPMEAASGGLSAMLELSWQIFLRGRKSKAFTVCIDEPENHLHPELQRTIIPSLLKGFPRASFIVATHSPYVVTAEPKSRVYALRPEDGRVNSQQVSGVNASATPDETLMSVLGLDTALPKWAEEALESALQVVPPRPSADDLRRLQSRLREVGLDRQFPAAIRAIQGGAVQ